MSLGFRIGWIVALAAVSGARAADWPMWRADAGHTGVAAQELSAELHLQWIREYPPLTTAWPDQAKLLFDRTYEPVVAGGLMFVGSNRNDTLTAVDVVSGKEKWVFHADGPLRFAPAAWKDRVFFGCDDGNLYCVAADNGRLMWKFRGGPSDRRILGNERLIGMWPVRGAPVVADGAVYFGAGIWPFMGIFLYALDAESGRVLWVTDGDGSMYIKQPHNAEAFAGVAPQGYMTVVGDKLLVPGGRSVPACYDRATGRFLYYLLADHGKIGGGYDVAAAGRLFVNGGALFSLETGRHLGAFGAQPVLGETLAAGLAAGKLKTVDPARSKIEITSTKDKAGKATVRAKWSAAEAASYDLPKAECVIRSGSRFYVGAAGRVFAAELPKDKAKAPNVRWQAEIAGTPIVLLAASERLFAVTLDGRIYCFGPTPVTQPPVFKAEPAAPPPADAWTARAGEYLKASGVRDGYAVVFGAGDGRLISELVRQSALHVIAVEPDQRRADAVRRRLIAEGLYGRRCAVHAGAADTFPLPPYLASLIVCDDPAGAGVDSPGDVVIRAYETLRPYGGVMCLRPSRRSEFGEIVRSVFAAAPAGAVAAQRDDLIVITRAGPLPGSADWTHEHGDAANSRVSRDDRVRLPLGVLWFGGSSNQGVLPRHGHGPQPHVVDGRLFIEGIDMLRAMDIYTGRVLWETPLPGVGKFYNNLQHQPGANGGGSNYVSTPDGVYIVHGRRCLRLDPATGKTLAEFSLPPRPGSPLPPEWGYINVVGDYLIGGADPLTVDPKDVERPRQLHLWDVASRKLKSTLEGHFDEVNAVAFAPDGKLVATGGDDKLVILWDAEKTKPAAVLKGHTEEVDCLVFSPDGRVLASGGKDKIIILWDVSGRKQIATLIGHTENVHALAFSPDGKVLLSGADGGVIKLWDVAEHQERLRLDGHTGGVTAAAFDREGRTVATSSRDGTVKLWDVASGELKLTLEGHKDDVLSVAFSPDGKSLITGGRDKSAKVWDVVGGKVRFSLDGHAGVVTSVSFSPDGRTAAAASDEAEVKFWDVESRKSLGTVKGKAGSYLSAMFSPDGKTLVAGGREKSIKAAQDNMSSSKRLVVMNRHSGAVYWSIDAHSGFRHNAVCAGGDRLYCIDRLSGGEVDRLKRRGLKAAAAPTLSVRDLKTGRLLWKTDKEVFGTWLSWSQRHDVLIEAGRGSRDAIKDEPKGMRAYAGSTGKVLWTNNALVGPPMLHGDAILREGGATDLLTGKNRTRVDPVTGQAVDWTWTRTYGCNTPSAATHLMTFRSGAAGFYDLNCDGGTGNFGGFRSSCTNNLIVAGGVLTAAEYTRTCTCSYQNQTSIALVPMPGVELWTQFPVSKGVKPSVAPPPPPPLQWVGWYFNDAWPPQGPAPVGKDLKHLALNVGAPGDRRAEDGRLWLNEYVHAKIEHDAAGGFYNLFSGRVKAVDKAAIAWVASSGCRGVRRVEIDPKLEGPRNAEGAAFTVRLHFADPDNDEPGRRVFDVAVQGRPVLTGFDVVRESGGRYNGIVREFRGTMFRGKLVVEFTGRAGAEPRAAPLLCGIEVVREE
jgi:WD40 repeat protein